MSKLRNPSTDGGDKMSTLCRNSIKKLIKLNIDILQGVLKRADLSRSLDFPGMVF